MKSILCYGDSNTWGFDPRTKQRFDAGTRWPGILRSELGEGFHVVEEGLNGRTTVWTDPLAEYRNGKHLLVPCLETHKPIDAVVLMLGTNDLKAKFSATAYDIGRGVATLIDIVLRSGTGPEGRAPMTLLVAPPPVAKLSEFAEMFEGAREKSRRLAAQYRAAASEFGCPFLDAGGVTQASDVDGIHLDPAAHAALGKAIAARLRDLMRD